MDWMRYHLLGTNCGAGGLYIDVEDGDEVDVTTLLGDIGLPGVLLADIADI